MDLLLQITGGIEAEECSCWIDPAFVVAWIAANILSAFVASILLSEEDKFHVGFWSDAKERPMAAILLVLLILLLFPFVACAWLEEKFWERNERNR